VPSVEIQCGFCHDDGLRGGEMSNSDCTGAEQMSRAGKSDLAVGWMVDELPTKPDISC
jgi:hypothetical protein